MFIPETNNGSIEIERETSSGNEEYEILDISSRTFNRAGELIEVDDAPVVPFPLNVPSRVILLSQIERDAERIHSSEPVEAEVIAVVPGLLMRPLIINNKVDLLTDPDEVMRVIAESRALFQRGSTSLTIEADFRMLLRVLPEAFNSRLPIPLGRDLAGREYRAKIFEVNTQHSRAIPDLWG